MSHPSLFLFPFLTLALAAQTVSPVGYDKKNPGDAQIYVQMEIVRAEAYRRQEG